MKLDEIIIPNELYSIYVDEIVWAKQHLDDVNHRQKKYEYEGYEMRPLFVLQQEGDHLIGLDTTTRGHWDNYPYAVKVGKGYVLCDKVKTVPINFDFPYVDKNTKEFLRDKNGNLIIKHLSVRSANFQPTEEQIEQIYERYNLFLKNK